MSCAQAVVAAHGGGDPCFSIDANAIVFGRGALAELGEHARAVGMSRVALFSDPRVAQLPLHAEAVAALKSAGLEVLTFDEVSVEPTDESFMHATRFAVDAKPDGYVSFGGGSVIDTCKAAALYATYPAPFLDYVNAPVGRGLPVPGPLPPHIACPTTCGTGSECTGIAVCDVLSLRAKTGIASRRLRPTLALVDPRAAATLPPLVVAASGFDVLCHALESYTARPSGKRPRPATPSARPMSQGSNPWSDVGSLEALRLGGRYLERAVRDGNDEEARDGLVWAATLAGVAFGNAGVHLPHGMSYAVAGLVRDFRMAGYPQEHPMVPHGASVVVNAPAVFRHTASANPHRHLEAAAALGLDVRSAAPEHAGALLAGELLRLMRATGVPVGLRAIGYGEADLDALVGGSIVQQRLLQNAPCAVDEATLRDLFRAALDA